MSSPMRRQEEIVAATPLPCAAERGTGVEVMWTPVSVVRPIGSKVEPRPK